MVICGAQPQKTVPLIASQISDRDNAVRSAALNAMVVVYGNVGDAVFKFTSKVYTYTVRSHYFFTFSFVITQLCMLHSFEMLICTCTCTIIVVGNVLLCG